MFKRRIFAALLAALLAVTSLLVTSPAAVAADYCSDNRIDVKTIVIVIDTLGVGETRLKASWERLRDMYWQIGENLVVANGDWLYYTSPPNGLSPLSSGTDLYLVDFLTELFSQRGEDFKWQRVFIHEGHYVLEPRDYGPRMPGKFCTYPDGEKGFFISQGDPFNGKNFIVNGFNLGPGDTGFHGAVHGDEGMLNCLDYERAKSFYQQYGRCHAVPESYLQEIGVTPDSNFLIDGSNDSNPIWWPVTDVKAYRQTMLSDEQQDAYNVYLLKKMREEFDLLKYYKRFFNWSPPTTEPAPSPSDAPDPAPTATPDASSPAPADDPSPQPQTSPSPNQDGELPVVAVPSDPPPADPEEPPPSHEPDETDEPPPADSDPSPAPALPSTEPSPETTPFAQPPDDPPDSNGRSILIAVIAGVLAVAAAAVFVFLGKKKTRKG